MADRPGTRAVTTVEIGRGPLRAAFVPDLGMVCTSLSMTGDEFVALPNTLEAYRERGDTTGIPLLHPWANRLGALRYQAGGATVDLEPSRGVLPFDGALPIHGARPGLFPFRVAAASATRVEAAFDTDASPELLRVFPYPHRLEVRAWIDEAALTIETTLVATKDVAVPISFGYHPYFRLPGSGRDEWTLDASAATRLVLDERMLPTGATEPVEIAGQALRGRSYDDAFTDLGPRPALVVADATHRLTVRFDRGYPYAQVYAPPGRDLIALEPMTAATDALRSGTGLRFAAPGEPFTARFSVSIDPAG